MISVPFRSKFLFLFLVFTLKSRFSSYSIIARLYFDMPVRLSQRCRAKRSKRPYTLFAVVRMHIRLKILKPVPTENVDVKPMSICFYGSWHNCILFFCDTKAKHCMLCTSTPKKKSYGKTRGNNDHTGRQREKIKNGRFLSKISLEAEPARYSAAHLHLLLID